MYTFYLISQYGFFSIIISFATESKKEISRKLFGELFSFAGDEAK